MSLKALRKAVKDGNQDKFVDGDVIAWTFTFDEGGIGYRYAAVKTPAGWATTAKRYSEGMKPTMTFKEILDVVADERTTDVMVATEWLYL